MGELEKYLAIEMPHERYLSAFFPLGSAPVVFDVGACEGEDLIRYARLMPGALFHVFEPIDTNLDGLRKNAAYHSIKLCRANLVAVSDRSDELEFHISSGRPTEEQSLDPNWNYGSRSSSLLAPSKDLGRYTGWLEFKRTVRVPTVRLDTYLQEQHISRIDFLHMDVQGAEMLALNGLGGRLRDVRCIWLEVSSVELYAGQVLKAELETFLKKSGFVRYIDTVDSVSGDQFWVNRRDVRLLAKASFVWLKSVLNRFNSTGR